MAKHAQASHVAVILEKTDAEAWLIVEDDGRGFEPDEVVLRAKADQRLGLAGIRERAALVGGVATIESARGTGTTIYVRFPLGSAATSALEVRP